MNTDAPGSLPADPIPPTPLPGQSLKHFRIEGLLGEGGMGLVYRAYDTQLHRPVAVKILSPELNADPERKQSLLQEARTAARIGHPGIAQIYYVDEVNGMTFIVMELVEGQTVRDLIHNRDLDLLGALDIGIQVADALAKAQLLGIVHRDIKPANVMLTRDGHVKILDFGLAKMLTPLAEPGPTGTKRLNPPEITPTQTGVVKGTPAYMSPEQVRGLAVDSRADIFSLGVLLFEMATGQSPFQRENFMDSLHAAAFADTPPMNSIRPHIPDGLQRIVSRCLRKEAADRYATAAQLAGDLRALRREMESGQRQKTSWHGQLRDAWERLGSLPRSWYVWFALGVAGLALGLYLWRLKLSWGSTFFFGFVAFSVFRHVRSRPHQIQDLFVRKVAKLPEVRLIGFQARQFTVVVDRPVAQLYGRINQHLSACNRKLYFGDPLTVSIVHDLTADQTRELLGSPGVRHVRGDVVGKG